MGFYIAKIIWFFLQPSSLILILLIAGLWRSWRGHGTSGFRLTALAAALYAAAGLSPLGHALMLPLEERFERAALPEGFEPAGLIILGGAIDTAVSAGRGVAALNEAAERMTEAISLARRYPQSKIIFSGGEGAMAYAGEPEAEGARRLFEAAGVDASRVIYEAKSRNTAENAALTKTALGAGAQGRFLLVTSAFHMPRAMGLFRKAGLDVSPWPVDYRTRGAVDLTRFFAQPSEGLRRTDLAVREWLGLLAYRVGGRIDDIFPAP